MSRDLVALIVVIAVAAFILRRLLAHLALSAFIHLLPRLSPELRLRISGSSRLVRGTHWRIGTLTLRLEACKQLGRTEEAVSAARDMLHLLPKSTCPWAMVNLAVDIFVNAGLYREALSVTELWSDAARTRGQRRDPISFALTKINQAEALHNLGRQKEALSGLDSVASLVEHHRFALNGLRCLRAWILIHVRDLSAAHAELSSVVPAAMRQYAAEILYAQAALERERGELDPALEHAEAGLAVARTASSRRNGKFLVASIAALKGDLSRARSSFNEAIASEYRAQGGDGLLRFAEFLKEHGDPAGAAAIYRLTIERDPESLFAATARERLEPPSPPATGA